MAAPSYMIIFNFSFPFSIECTRVLYLADAFFQSWTYWDSKYFWTDNGKVVKDLVSVFSRPYPIATNGIPKKMTYDYASKEFHFEFIPSSNETSFKNECPPTEIFVPPITYPNSQFDIEMSDSLSWMFSPDDLNIIFVVQTKKNNDLKAEIPVYLKLRPLVSVFRSGG